jgi:hypothetical protein
MKLLANLDYDKKKAAAFFARLVENDTWVCPTTLVWSEASYRDEEDLINDPRFEYMPAYSKTKRFYVSFLKFCMPKTTPSQDVAVIL